MADLPPMDWQERGPIKWSFPVGDTPNPDNKGLLGMIDVSEMRVMDEGEDEIFEIIWRGDVGYVPEALNTETIYDILRSYVETHTEIPEAYMLRRETALWGVKEEYIEACVEQICVDVVSDTEIEQHKAVARAAVLGELMLEASVRDANRIKRKIKEVERRERQPVKPVVGVNIVPVIELKPSAITEVVTVLSLNGDEKNDPQRDRVIRTIGPWLQASDGRMRAKVLLQRLEDGLSLHSDKAQEYLDFACERGIIFKKSINGTVFYLDHEPGKKLQSTPVEIAANNEHRGEMCESGEIVAAILALMASPETSMATGYTPKQMQTELYRRYIGRGKHATVGAVKEAMLALVETGVMERKFWESRRGNYKNAVSAGQFMAGLASSEVKLQLQNPDYSKEIVKSLQNPKTNTDS